MEISETTIREAMYAITARLGRYPQSRFFGAVTNVINQMRLSGKVETKPCNLRTPLYRMVPHLTLNCPYCELKPACDNGQWDPTRGIKPCVTVPEGWREVD